MRRPGPATLEPPADAGSPVQDDDRVPPTQAPRVDRSFIGPARSTPASSATLTAAARAEQEIAARRTVTDYGYVIGELKRIFITALIVVIALIVIALIHR